MSGDFNEEFLREKDWIDQLTGIEIIKCGQAFKRHAPEIKRFIERWLESPTIKFGGEEYPLCPFVLLEEWGCFWCGIFFPKIGKIHKCPCHVYKFSYVKTIAKRILRLAIAIKNQ